MAENFLIFKIQTQKLHDAEENKLLKMQQKIS